MNYIVREQKYVYSVYRINDDCTETWIVDRATFKGARGFADRMNAKQKPRFCVCTNFPAATLVNGVPTCAHCEREIEK